MCLMRGHGISSSSSSSTTDSEFCFLFQFRYNTYFLFDCEKHINTPLDVFLALHRYLVITSMWDIKEV